VVRKGIVVPGVTLAFVTDVYSIILYFLKSQGNFGEQTQEGKKVKQPRGQNGISEAGSPSILGRVGWWRSLQGR
jgi:hypothetical protein